MTMYPHRIRLRGPWECMDKASASVPRRVTVPCQLSDAGLSDFDRRSVFLVRKFGYPGPDRFLRKSLAHHCGHQGAVHRFSVNNQALGTAGGPCEFDVTKLLKPHNCVEIILAAAMPEDVP